MVGQWPLPSQLAAGVNVLPTQVARRHPVVVDQGRHAPQPLQVPSLEQSPLDGLLATQRRLGSVWPSGTGVQVPTLPGTRQLMHRPPTKASLHGESQQTPSVQNPLLHCEPAVQVDPLDLRPQKWFTQVVGDTHSLSFAQLSRQLSLLQV